LKDGRFLDFFFRRLRQTTKEEADCLRNCGIEAAEYPFVSPCGRELNFVRPAATPIVFHSLTADRSQLVYGGSLVIPFDPTRLAISNKTGRLYHQVVGTGERKTNMEELKEYGLVRSSLAVTLSEHMTASSTRSNAFPEGMDLSGMDFLTNSNEKLSIPVLPEELEPGSWAMPVTEDDDIVEMP
jgi:hypothetical protein